MRRRAKKPAAIKPTAVYDRHDVAALLGYTVPHVARLRREKGLPIVGGYITGGALLGWLERRDARD